MVRDATVNENNFVSIFSDAVVLYEAALTCENEVLKSALVKSSILSVNYALEAAANSFLQSVKVENVLAGKIDRFSTLEKFDFVLQWHTDDHLDFGNSQVQAIKNLIANRHNMVHPKVTPTLVKVETTTSPSGRLEHTVLKAPLKKGQDPKPKLLGLDPDLYTAEDAKEALVVMTSFLNIFVEEWWGIGYESADLFLFQTWDGSKNARSIMFAPHQISTLIRNDDFLKIRFIGLHGMF